MQLSAPRVPLRIRPVVSAVFAPLHPARGQPTDGRQSLASTRNRSANCRPVVSGSVARAGIVPRDKWRKWQKFGGLPKHIRIAICHAASGADAVLVIATGLAVYHGQLRCPANSAASRSAGGASPRCVRPDRYRPPGQVPLWPATSCAGVRVAISLGRPGNAGLWPG
jgi:hypothetical protein